MQVAVVRRVRTILHCWGVAPCLVRFKAGRGQHARCGLTNSPVTGRTSSMWVFPVSNDSDEVVELRGPDCGATAFNEFLGQLGSVHSFQFLPRATAQPAEVTPTTSASGCVM